MSFKGFPGGSVLKNPTASAADAGHVGSIPGSGRFSWRMQTAKASRKQSSLSGKESAQCCIPQRLLGRPD